MTDEKRPPRQPGRTGGGLRRPVGLSPPPGRSAASEPRDDARVAKVMARAGLCSRRDAETWILAGRVAVNGRVIDSPALNISPGDRVTVDGMPLPEREAARLFLFHKPRGVVTTAKDPEGRQTVFDILPEGLPRVVSVGRLDINTEGLMLLTNDGGLARVLELPSTGWLRRYRVRANGEVTQQQLDGLKGGVTVDGVDYAGVEATLDRVQGANVWLTMGLREGKNREIKRILEDLGLAVTRLIRVSFGPFELGELPAGAAVEIRPRVLREQLGPALAREAGLTAEDAERSPRPRPVRQDRPKPAPRAHVSALRAAAGEKADEGRRRTARSATADRRGRTVAVERITSTVEKPADLSTYNARRFARERDPDRAGSERPKAERPRGVLESRPRSGADPARERPQRPPASRPSGGRPTGPGRDRPDRAEGPRPARGRDGDSGRPVEGRARFSGDRRAAGERPAGDRPFGGGRPSSGERPRDGGARGRDDRPVGAGRPSRDRPGGSKRPLGGGGGHGKTGKAGGRPFGGGGRPGSGSRPSGGGRPKGGAPKRR